MRTDEPYTLEAGGKHACRLSRPQAVAFSQNPAGRAPRAPTWAAASHRPAPLNSSLPHPKGLSAGEGDGTNYYQVPLGDPELKWRSAGAGERAALATRRSLVLRARGVAAVGDAAQPRPALCSAIFFESPGLPPRPRWLRASLPAADRDRS